MNERDRTIHAVTAALIVFAALCGVVGLLGGCSGGTSSDDGGPCDWFALAAAPATAKAKDRTAAPPRTSDRLQKDPPPATTTRPGNHRDDDLCD
ncbi:hypothetical protein [Streptomyces sp. NPDC058548]|uniref:hypothetical protein n=1 Tax=Streptomyces sp. NPDC058548 TaxID=3346545 RepID=UPI00365D4DD3